MPLRKRFVTLALLTLIAALAWFGLAFRPAQSRLAAVREEVKSTQQEITDLESRLQRLLELQRNEPQLKDEADRMVVALPNEPNVPAFIIQVQDAANEAGIDFLSIVPALPAVPVAAGGTGVATDAATDAAPGAEESAPVSPLRSISVQVNADGGYFEVQSFVLRLEQLARAVKIKDLSLTGGQEGGGLSASMSLEMFMVVPQDAAPDNIGAHQSSENQSGAL